MIKPLLLTTLLVVSSWAQAFEFIGIADDEAIRANSGNLWFQVNAEVPYTLYHNDEVVIHRDPGVNSHAFSNLDRGTHTFEIVSANERKKITVHVLRVHRNFP